MKDAEKALENLQHSFAIKILSKLGIEGNVLGVMIKPICRVLKVYFFRLQESYAFCNAITIQTVPLRDTQHNVLLYSIIFCVCVLIQMEPQYILYSITGMGNIFSLKGHLDIITAVTGHTK